MDISHISMVGRSLRESWCFCKGVSKSERIKAAIFSGNGHAVATVINATSNGVGFLIHRNLLLTTHANLPSAVAADTSEIRLHGGVAATLLPHRFFITSSVLDLTIVGVDDVDGESNAQGHYYRHYLKTCCKTNVDLGSVVYLLGHTEKQELTVGEGKVVIATDNLIKLSTHDGFPWFPGSAGFDVHGNLAFMICDPMKLATSPNTKSSSTSSSSSLKKDPPMQFGIPIPVICDWLNQHWEGSLDDLNKPRLTLIRLMSTGAKSEHSCASFTLRQVFKSTEVDSDDDTLSTSSNAKTRDQDQSSSAVVEEESSVTNPNAAHVQGITTPEIYESPRVTALPLRKKEDKQIHLLDINFPPIIYQPAVLPQSSNLLNPKSAEKVVKNHPLSENGLGEQNQDRRPETPREEVDSTGSVDAAQSDVLSSSSFPIEVSEKQNEYNSEEETMYSAETAESCNYTTPREVKLQQVGRSQSCDSYNRFDAAKKNQASRRTMLEHQRSFIHGKKMHYSQGATPQRSNANDYFSHTVSSVMKRNPEHNNKPWLTPVRSSSPRWML